MKCLSKSTSGKAILLDHAAGRLRGSVAVRVTRHLLVCPECQELSDRQTRVWELLDVWEASPVTTTFNRTLYARIQARPASLWESIGRVLNQWVKSPALPLAALSLLVIVGFYLERPPQATQTMGRPAVLDAPVAVSPTDAEQLDKALDDLQLLHQLDAVKDEAAEASKAM